MYGLIIGNFNKGPVNERTFITNQQQADIVVGKPTPGSDISYHILHTYLTKSKRCWVYRVVDQPLYGGVVIGSNFNVELGDGDGVTKVFSGTLPMDRCHPGTVSIWVGTDKVGYDDAAGNINGTLLDGTGTNVVTYDDGNLTVTFTTAPPTNSKIYARWGYPSYAFTSGMADPATYEFDDYQLTQELEFSGLVYTDVLVPFPLVEPASTVTSVGTANTVIYDGTTPIAYADEFGALQDVGSYLDALATNTVDYTNGEITFTLDPGYTPVSPLTTKYYGRTTHNFVVYGDNPGIWTDTYEVVISKVNVPNYRWNIACYENRGNLLPIRVSDYEVSKAFKKDGFDRQMHLEERINGNDYYIRVKDNIYLDPEDELLPDYLRYSVPSETIAHNNVTMSYVPIIMSGGFHGYTPNVSAYVTALRTFNNKEDVKIDIVMDTVGHYTYQLEVAKLCDRDFGGRGDCYGVIYVPFEHEESNNYISDTVNYRKYTLNLSSSFVGLYFGHVKIFDGYNGREIFIPPSGFVGAAFSYTADQYEPWFPAAGWRRGKLPVLDVYRRLQLGERDILYDNDINCMKYKPGRGIAIWGQKTLYGVASALDRANVRWLLIVAENAIEDFLDDYEFEINDAYTRTLITAAVVSYLSSIKSRRGLYAFDVVCNESNNPDELIDQYRLNVDYYLQPTKPIKNKINFSKAA